MLPLISLDYVVIPVTSSVPRSSEVKHPLHGLNSYDLVGTGSPLESRGRARLLFERDLDLFPNELFHLPNQKLKAT